MTDELEKIAAEAAAVEAAGAAPVEQVPGAPVMPVRDPVQEWKDAAHMGCGLVVSMLPELKTEWTPEKIDSLGEALAKCAERYGWTVGELLGHPLLALAFASFGLVAPMARILKQKAAEKAAKRGELQGAGAPENPA